ncbi:MAG: hypothetical protein Q7Q73_02405 [Verrucomicrobiota bacterium JB024]|jgi:uncharacterized membrane protein YdcZ (DUF606 family)|nr:hypothetical protein [Verrucomicrobiota bacterium JB024]
MAVLYDESVIIKEAELLYRQARGLALRTAFVYALVGGIAGAVFMLFPAVANEDSCMVIGSEAIVSSGLFCGIIAGLAGWSSGQAKGRKLRLEAQSALCQVAIERNTRPPQVG